MEANQNNLTVAVLLKDIQKAQKICSSFRKIGILPHYYESLDSFWFGILDENPALAIVDVERMSDGELVLKNHPRIKDKMLPVVFYHTNQTVPLLKSAYELLNYGLLNGELAFDGQLKAVLERINRDRIIVHENARLKSKLNEQKNRAVRLVMDQQQHRRQEDYNDLIHSLIKDIEKHCETNEFFEAISETFLEWEDLNQFAYYEISQNGQKLLSPKTHNSKFKELPSLWLGQHCKEGIEPFALNMALQVSIDILGSDLITVKLSGYEKFPNVTMFLKVEPDIRQHLSWSLFEKLLSGIFIKEQAVKLKEMVGTDVEMNPFNFLALLNEHTNDPAKEEVKVVDINLSLLLHEVKKRPTLNFYWKNFYQEFIGGLRVKMKETVQVVCFGVHHLGIVCSSHDFDAKYSFIKSYVGLFPYWRFFENSDLILTGTVVPEVKLIPTSSLAYMYHVEKSYEGLERAMRRVQRVNEGRKVREEEERPWDLYLNSNIVKEFESERSDFREV